MIKLDGAYSDYKIKADSNQYILLRDRIAQEGEHAGEAYDEYIGYYRTVSDALRGLMRKTHREQVAAQDMTLKEACDALDRIYNGIIWLTDEGEEV